MQRHSGTLLALSVIMLFINGIQGKDYCPSVHKSIVCTCYGFQAVICNGNRSDEVPNPVRRIVKELRKWPNRRLPLLYVSLSGLRRIAPGTFQNLSIDNLVLPENQLQLENLTELTFIGLEESVQQMNLGGNNLSMIPGGALKNLKNLTILKLPMNSIQFITHGQMHDISQVQVSTSITSINIIMVG